MRLTMNVSLGREAAAVSQSRCLLDGLLRLADVAERCRADLGVVITEACSNAVVHADRGGHIEVSVLIDDLTCVVEVGNDGGWLSDHRFTADMPDPLADGGRGLPLIAAFADGAGFTCPRPGWLVLHIRKILTFVDRGADEVRSAGIRIPRP